MGEYKVNKWLTLGANIGVLVGIMFLAVELRQNNDIAVRTYEIRLPNPSIHSCRCKEIHVILLHLKDRELMRNRVLKILFC